MSNNKISGIHAIGVEIPKGMSFKELMEQLLEGGEAELEKELDEETRQPETGKCDCPVCDPDKDTVEERLFHPVDQWQHAVDDPQPVADPAACHPTQAQGGCGMSIEALRRKKRRMRRPKPRLTDGQKSAVLLALTFFEGWLVGFAGTHSRIPSPVGTPQWMITGSLALAVILPLMFVGILLKWGGDGTAE